MENVVDRLMSSAVSHRSGVHLGAEELENGGVLRAMVTGKNVFSGNCHGTVCLTVNVVEASSYAAGSFALENSDPW